MKLFTYYRYRLIFSAGRARRPRRPRPRPRSRRRRRLGGVPGLWEDEMFARQGSVPSSFPGTRAKMNTKLVGTLCVDSTDPFSKFIHPSRHQGPSPARDSYEALYILPLPTNLQCWARAPSSTSSSSTSLSSSSSSGRSTRVNSSRAPCSSVQEELLRQRRNQRQSEAIKRPSRGN